MKNYYNVLCRVTVTTSCQLRFHLYPHDDQSCALILESCKYDNYDDQGRIQGEGAGRCAGGPPLR